MITISKSKYLAGLQCPKLLWHHFNAKEKIPAPDAAAQALFDQGHDVGEWAKKLYPSGVEVEWEKGFTYTLQRTKELISSRSTIFEGSFIAPHAYARADILVPVGEAAWDLIEVKSSSEVKEEHIEDVAFQLHTLEKNGVVVRRAHIMHIDNEYVRQGEIDPAKLLFLQDVTEAATLKLSEIPGRIEEMVAVITGGMPETPIGPHCTKPYRCGLIGQCWAHLPENNVTELYYNNGFTLLGEGVLRIADVPCDRLSAKQLIQQRAILTGRPKIAEERIKKWLSDLEYPLYLLDFETVAPAIPLWDGTRPYQQVPFQFSLHIIKKPGDTPEHVEFLWESTTDPRPALIKALRAIGPTGTILAYSMGFERRVLRELAASHPEQETFLLGIESRLDDLIIPFREFWYYHPAQHGSCSIKAVLPALTGSGYEELHIQKGDEAGREWLRAVRGAKDAEDVFRSLREYCGLDTLAMVKILQKIGG